MSQVFATVSSKGQLVIPAEMREALGIEPGTRVSIHQQGDELILRPVTKKVAHRIIDRLCGLTAGGASMTDELLAERRTEDEGSGW